jgi:hypothetical protein
MKREENPQLYALAELAQAVRLAQKAYFKTRSRETLLASKRLENAIDLKVIEILGSPPPLVVGETAREGGG